MIDGSTNTETDSFKEYLTLLFKVCIGAFYGYYLPRIVIPYYRRYIRPYVNQLLGQPEANSENDILFDPEQLMQLRQLLLDLSEYDNQELAEYVEWQRIDQAPGYFTRSRARELAQQQEQTQRQPQPTHGYNLRSRSSTNS